MVVGERHAAGGPKPDLPLRSYNPPMPVTVVRVDSVGRRGAERTVHYLSNGWWIVDTGQRGSREHRFALYRPGVGDTKHATFVASGEKLRKLIGRADA